MSRSNHSAVAHEIMFVVNEVNRLPEEEVKSLYGIEIFEDGRVFDQTYNKIFGTVGEWAQFNVEQDDVQYEEHFHGKETEEY